MLLLLIVCLMKLVEMYTNNNKMARKCARNAKENHFGSYGVLHKGNSANYVNQKYGMFDESFVKHQDGGDRFSMNYFYDVDQSCVDQLKEFLNRKTGINSYRGMSDYSTTQPATVKSKLIKTGLLTQQTNPQQIGFQSKPSVLKQPLSSLNTNNNNYVSQQQINRTRILSQSKNVRNGNESHLNAELSDDALKSNVQIVLNNIQNALLNQQQRKDTHQDLTYQDRFQYLNIFGGNSPPSNGVIVNQRNCKLQNLRKMSTSPADSDNITNNNMGPASMLGCSFASDFTHDNSDYQWFVDYGYRDGVQHHSILSSLSASYNGIGELSYYDDMAKNLDANLAEVDMENFRSEDIHSLLRIQQEEGSISSTRKLILKDQTEFDSSICKSEILFSPVKESHISVDSLDMDGYQDDIILTCQANKNNYTIAFEGSCMYSDESYYDIPENGKIKQNLDNAINNKKKIEADMTQSDTGFTTWSQLKKSSDFIHMHRYPSGNNNNNNNNTNNNNNNTITTCTHHISCSARRSSSMPNLKAILQHQVEQLQHQNQLNVSEVATNNNESSMDTVNKLKTMLPMYSVPITTSESENPAPMNNSSISNNEKVANPPSFNLVKLFIKQKSSSSDTCMDVSSGCWPSDSTNSSTEHPGNGSNNNLSRLRKKSMNDSGKCSALSRHEEDAEYQLDSLDATQVNGNTGEKKTNDFNREIFDSPTHKRIYKDCALNIRNQLKNPLLFNVLNNNANSINNNQSQSDASRTSENLTQILKHDDGGSIDVISASKTRVPIDMITKSIQTSILLQQPETKKLPQSQVKMIPPSFLSQLSKLGDQQQAPVYVIYPNYALPDLEFINQQPLKLQKEIIMSPLDYHTQFNMTRTLNLKQQKPTPQRRRPQSLNIDKLQQNQYEHVQDWNSLLTLLPCDYRKLLKNVPEVNKIAVVDTSSQKPMFCMSPPIRRTANGLACDCQMLVQNHTQNSSSSGDSSHQPSSGFRGSSTMLTDSEMEVIINGGSGNDAMRNMFVYQYDNVPEMAGHEQRPPTGRRGILRRTNTTSNTPTRVTNINMQKPKRYSMLDQPKSPQQQFKNLPTAQQTQQEKRRSLQEPNFYNNGLEEYFMNIGGNKTFTNRLPNYMKARDDQSDIEKDINQLMTELELNKALSDKLNYGNQNGTDLDIQEIEARLRAESFLNSLPKSELKHYAEVANLLEWHQQEMPIESTKLRNEVSKALSSRKVSFNHPSPTPSPKKRIHLQAPDFDKKFTTPPNSPQISQLGNNSGGKVMDKKQQQKLEKEKQDKIQSNRFKRLQIQWELLSKDQLEHDVLETKSGGTTPTGSSKPQSKIPRPVSYPNSKQTPELQIGKNLRSPSRMAPPKKYTTTPTNQTITSPTTGIPRTPNKLHTTPKKTLPARSATRTR